MTSFRASHLLVILAAVSLLAILSIRPAAAANPCCNITGISGSGIVTAIDNTTGKSFEFSVKDIKQLQSLHIGQPLSADYKSGMVSVIDGGVTTGRITRQGVQSVAGLGSLKPPSAMAAIKVLGSADGEKSGSRIDVTELKRVSGNMVSLKLVLVNDSNDAITIGEEFEPKVEPPSQMGVDNGSISGVYLVDAVGGTQYNVVRDAHGVCVCSTGLSAVGSKSKMNLWAKFPAPPESVTKVTVTMPHFPPIEDVPLTP
jgi:hypothetical protein